MEAYLKNQLAAVLAQIENVPDDFDIEFQTPARPEHGDLATNTALRLAKPLRRSPRTIAEDLLERLQALPLDPDRIAAIEVAGPGFLNFRFSNRYLTHSIEALLEADEDYGKTDDGQGQRALVEYVSANPTGPLTVGHGRNTVLGDTIATLLEWTGYDVQREYYFNDAGRQMRVLGESVRARYEELVGQPGAPFPEDGYQGEYIITIAQALADEHGDALLKADSIDPFKDAAVQAIFAEIDATMKRLGVHMEHYFNEHTLYTSNAVWDVLDRLREAGYVYEHDGAVWFKTTELGKDQDTVLVKSTGEPTYRLPDIAYHANKLDRGFDRIVDIFGADHIATYPDVVRGLKVLGYDASKVDVVIYQFVTLVRSGELVKMSTRRANYVTLDDLMDEVGEDVTRFFFLMRSPTTHLEFDLDLAKEASDKNPVFYLQYAHARICSIMRKVEDTALDLDTSPDLDRLDHPSAISLMKTLIGFPSEIQTAASLREPHRLATYLRDVATAFNQFYRDCRILGEAEPIARARLALAQAARITLRNGLTILGLSAPEQM